MAVAGLEDEAHGVIPDISPTGRRARIDWKKRAIAAEADAYTSWTHEEAARGQAEALRRETVTLRLWLLGTMILCGISLLFNIRLVLG